MKRLAIDPDGAIADGTPAGRAAVGARRRDGDGRAPGRIGAPRGPV